MEGFKGWVGQLRKSRDGRQAIDEVFAELEASETT